MAAPAKKKAASKAKKKKEAPVEEAPIATSPIRTLVQDEMIADMREFVGRIFSSAEVAEFAPSVTDYLIEKGAKQINDVYLPFVYQISADLRKMSDTQRTDYLAELTKSTAGAVKPRRAQSELFWQNDKWAASAYVADLEMAVLRERPKINEGAFTCRRCQSRRTRLRTKEGGRGDEMIPVVIECVGCGHTWNE